MKILLIGNSHLAAVRAGWSIALPKLVGLTADLYAAHAKALIEIEHGDDGELRLASKLLWHFSSSGEAFRETGFYPAKYDASIIVGCDFGPTNVFRTYRRLSFYGLAGKGRQIVSRENFLRAVKNSVQQSAAGILMSLIKTTTDSPIYIVPTPMPSEAGYLDTEHRLMEPWRAASENGDENELKRVYDEICEEQRRLGVVIIQQPAETLVAPLRTNSKYSQGSLRLKPTADILHPEDDYFHMNADYGALVWEAIKDAVH
jgi:hypothetical protein